MMKTKHKLRRLLNRFFSRTSLSVPTQSEITTLSPGDYWEQVFPCVARLLVELEAAGRPGSRLQAATEWLEDMRMGHLLQPADPVPCKYLDDAALVHRAFFIADEVDELDGTAALDFAAGFIWGNAWSNNELMRLPSDPARYLLETGHYLATYPKHFCHGFERRSTECMALLNRTARQEAEL